VEGLEEAASTQAYLPHSGTTNAWKMSLVARCLNYGVGRYAPAVNGKIRWVHSSQNYV